MITHCLCGMVSFFLLIIIFTSWVSSSVGTEEASAGAVQHRPFHVVVEADESSGSWGNGQQQQQRPQEIWDATTTDPLMVTSVSQRSIPSSTLEDETAAKTWKEKSGSVSPMFHTINMADDARKLEAGRILRERFRTDTSSTDVKCGEILDTLFANEAWVLLNTIGDKLFPSSTYAQLIFKTQIMTRVRFGVQIRKVCSSCDEVRHLFVVDGAGEGLDNDESFQHYCGPDTYGSNVVHSGLLLIPAILTTDGTSKLRTGIIPGFIYGHSSSTDTTDSESESSSSQSCPSQQWNGINSSLDVMMGLITAVTTGSIVILPDFMGCGESYGHTSQSYTTNQKSYQTSTVPLWFKSKSVITSETDCATALADGVLLGGYGEGGYASVAIAEALSSTTTGSSDLHILSVEVGGAPLRAAGITTATERSAGILDNSNGDDLAVALEHVTYPVRLCHSIDDTVIDIGNLPNFTQNIHLTFVPTHGTHYEAGVFCRIQTLLSVTANDYLLREYTAKSKHSTDGCPTLTPTGVPTSLPTPAPTTDVPNSRPSTPPPTTMGVTPTSDSTVSQSSQDSLPRYASGLIYIVILTLSLAIMFLVLRIGYSMICADRRRDGSGAEEEENQRRSIHTPLA